MTDNQTQRHDRSVQIVVTPRRLDVSFPDSTPRYWFKGSPFLTHMMNVYTLLVPDNESYYIRQLKRCLGEIEDPTLKQELLRFFRQEGQHGIGHKAFWRNLEQQGIRYQGFVNSVGWFSYRFLEPLLPRAVHLSNIACIEHINAYLGQLFLARRLLEGADERMQLLFEWHFAEEIEHKAIAFDVYQAVSGSYLIRILGAILVFPLFYLINTLGIFYFLGRDGRLFAWDTWRDFGRYLFQDGALVHTLRSIGLYLLPGFHPWNTQDYGLARTFFERAETKLSIHPIESTD